MDDLRKFNPGDILEVSSGNKISNGYNIYNIEKVEVLKKLNANWLLVRILEGYATYGSIILSSKENSNITVSSWDFKFSYSHYLNQEDNYEIY